MRGATNADPVRRQDNCGERRWAWVWAVLRTRIIAISRGTFTACHLSGPIVGGIVRGDQLVAWLVLGDGAVHAAVRL
jgi:hypothetical protein